MKLHELPRTTQDRKRVGRSISAGGGKTAGRGTKGQKSRTGKKLRFGFEGGQMPLAQRLPKRRGFRRISPKPVSISVDRLIQQGITTVNPKALKAAGLIESEKVTVKIIAGTTEPSKKFSFSDVKLSGSLANTSAKSARAENATKEGEPA